MSISMDKSPLGLYVFLKEWMAHPGKVGAVLPSSRRLARTLAKAIPEDAKQILELGAGTGVVTKAILARHQAIALTSIEQAAELVLYLKQHYPQVEVLEGDAANLVSALQIQKETKDAIVSSLPLALFSENLIKQVLIQAKQVLKPGGIFIQFTYRIFSPYVIRDPNFVYLDSHLVFWNVPPARVEIYRYDPSINL